VAWLKENAEYSDYQADPEDAVMFRRAAELLERHAAQVPADAPAAPPPDGEVAELVAQLRSRHYGPAALDRAAELLERRHTAPVPVPVSERLPQPEDCAPWPGDPNLSDWCWVGRDVDGGWEWEQRSADCLLAFYEDWFTHWLPANSLPLPAQGGEVQP
jgi:hypothetical protein